MPPPKKGTERAARAPESMSKAALLEALGSALKKDELVSLHKAVEAGYRPHTAEEPRSSGAEGIQGIEHTPGQNRFGWLPPGVAAATATHADATANVTNATGTNS